MKSAAKRRSIELIADFDNQLAVEYAFDDDVVWADATTAAAGKGNSLGGPRRL